MGSITFPKFSKSHVPAIGNDIDILFFIKNEEVDLQYLNHLKEISSFNDEVIEIPFENQEMVQEIFFSDLPPNWN